MASLWNQKLEKLAEALADGKSPVDAARAAGYTGNSIKHNARKYAGRNDVKARVAELLAPGVKETERQIAINTEFVLTRAAHIASAKKPASAIKVSDQVAALNLIAKIIGAIAPEKHALTDKEGNDLTIMALLQAVDGRTRDLPPHEPSSIPKGS